MPPIHQGLANGHWQDFSLVEQMGNTGSEVGRAIRARTQGMPERAERAMERALELLDLTIADSRWRRRLRELTRAREVLCDWFYGENDYHSNPESLEKYFLAFGIAARMRRESQISSSL